MLKEKLIKAHTDKFGTKPEITAFAPGRVNFIGEHTDYNGGLVMPLALNMGVYAAISKNTLGKVRILSLDFDQYGEFDLDVMKPDPKQGWANCPKGMIQMLQNAGCKMTGIDLSMTGDLPMGSGLSSSAAAEVATGFAVKELFRYASDGLKLALLAQKAEHEFTGTLCGIMDQAISVMGRRNSLLQLSCRDLKFEYAPFQLKGLKLLIVNSGVKHNLAQGEYNVRRRECEEALNVARKIKPGIETLSDFPIDLLEENKLRFADIPFKRARHVLGENHRVRSTVKRLSEEDFTAVGNLLVESHRSLQKDYAVSCEELDFLVDHAVEQKGVLGARMTGGGFGGCVIVLLEEGLEPAYRDSLKDYQKTFGIVAQVYEAVASDGARRLD